MTQIPTCRPPAVGGSDDERHPEGGGQVRLGEHLLDQAGRDNPAVTHQQGVPEAWRDLLEVMGDQDRGRGVGVEGQARQRRDEVLAAAQVQTRGRLVEEEELGVGHQGPGDLDPLALALTERPERALGQIGAPRARRAGRRPAPRPSGHSSSCQRPTTAYDAETTRSATRS